MLSSFFLNISVRLNQKGNVLPRGHLGTRPCPKTRNRRLHARVAALAPHRPSSSRAVPRAPTPPKTTPPWPKLKAAEHGRAGLSELATAATCHGRCSGRVVDQWNRVRGRPGRLDAAGRRGVRWIGCGPLRSRAAQMFFFFFFRSGMYSLRWISRE